MATAPCDRHHEPRPGRLCGAYLTLIHDGVRNQKYRRLCVPCSREVLDNHARDWWDTALKGKLAESSACTSCGTVSNGHNGLVLFYATVYPSGRDRRDYTAMYCPDCALKIAQEFDLDV